MTIAAAQCDVPDLFSTTAEQLAAASGRPIEAEVADLMAPPPPPSPAILAAMKARGLREEILERIAACNAAYVARLRELAEEIARGSQTGLVTIDDVRDALAAAGIPMPKEVGIDERVFGTLFRSRVFEPVGQRPTTREAWRQRVGKARCNVTVYRLRHADAV